MQSASLKGLRRTVAAVLTLLCVAMGLTGCRPLVPEEETPVTVYATFYPIYALADAVLQDVPDMALHCLVQPQDGCLRAYQLSDWDIALLKRGADAVICGGRGLESFEDTLFGWGEHGPVIAAVLYNLELYGQGQATDGESQSHLHGPNPHLYMSLEGARSIVESLSATMVSLDPDYAEEYIKNAQAATEGLDALRETLRDRLDGCKGKRVALMSEALVYVARDYGLEIARQIDRETGASFGDNELKAWLEQLKDARVDAVLLEKQAPQALGEALARAGYSVARLDVLSTHREGEGFDCYLEIQSANAQALLEALAEADGGKEDH